MLPIQLSENKPFRCKGPEAGTRLSGPEQAQGTPERLLSSASQPRKGTWKGWGLRLNRPSRDRLEEVFLFFLSSKDILTKPHDDGVCHRDTRADQKESELEQFEY